MNDMKTTTASLILVALATLSTAGRLPASQNAPAPAATPAQAPSAGDVIPEFDAQGVDGSAHRVEFKKGSRTVLVFFLSGCPSCHKMIPEWNRAFSRKPAGLDMVGVLMDQEPPGFFTAMPIAFPVVRSPGRKFMDSLKVQRAPLTLRVAAGGKVEDVALGIIDPIRLGEFFRP